MRCPFLSTKAKEIKCFLECPMVNFQSSDCVFIKIEEWKSKNREINLREILDTNLGELKDFDFIDVYFDNYNYIKMNNL